ncbi:MAG TPA: hypothetical protein VGI23_04995 [Steroidobacteraceae bacterium]|jgi:hypothetical protein
MSAIEPSPVSTSWLTPWSAASDRKIYGLWIALVWVGMLGGFGLDFTRYLGETPAPPFILHFHAAVYVLWLALVTFQILWIETGNVRRHIQLGWLTVGLSVLMVPLGLTAALVDQVRQVGHPDYAPQFLALEFEEMLAFSVFMTAGVLFRWNAAAHKRLMLLSAVSISDAGFARIWLMGIKIELPGLFGWWLQYFWGIFLMLIAMAAWDWWRRRRIHPAVLLGAALLWTCEMVVTVLNFTPAWQQAMVRLVNAWGRLFGSA